MRKQVLSIMLVVSLLLGITTKAAFATVTQPKQSGATMVGSLLYTTALDFTADGSTPAQGEGYSWNASTKTLTLSGRQWQLRGTYFALGHRRLY